MRLLLPSQSLSTRLLSSGWFVFVVFFLVAYAIALNAAVSYSYSSVPCHHRSNHTDAATTSFSSSPPETLEEMLDDPDFRFALLDEGTTHRMLQVLTRSTCVFRLLLKQGSLTFVSPLPLLWIYSLLCIQHTGSTFR